MLDREAWLALAEGVMPLLAQAWRRRLPATNAALKLVPAPWDALALPHRALAAWGTAAGMIALAAKVGHQQGEPERPGTQYAPGHTGANGRPATSGRCPSLSQLQNRFSAV
jgi:hypothetical protein